MLEGAELQDTSEEGLIGKKPGEMSCWTGCRRLSGSWEAPAGVRHRGGQDKESQALVSDCPFASWVAEEGTGREKEEDERQQFCCMLQCIVITPQLQCNHTMLLLSSTRLPPAHPAAK